MSTTYTNSEPSPRMIFEQYQKEKKDQETLARRQLEEGLAQKRERERLDRERIKRDGYDLNCNVSMNLEEALNELGEPKLNYDDPHDNLLEIQEHFVKAMKLSLYPTLVKSFSLCYKQIDTHYLIPMAKGAFEDISCLEMIHELCNIFNQKRNVEKRMVNTFKAYRYNFSSDYDTIDIYKIDAEDNIFMDEKALGEYYKRNGYVSDYKNLWRSTDGRYEKVYDQELAHELISKIQPQFGGKQKLTSAIWSIKASCFQKNFDPNHAPDTNLLDTNPIQDFLDDLFDFNEACGYPVTITYHLYKQHCLAVCKPALEQSEFKAAITSIPGISRKSFNHDNCRCYGGIALSSDKIRNFKGKDNPFPVVVINYLLEQNRKRKSKVEEK